MKLRNIWLGLKDQGPPSRFFRNLRKGHLIGWVNKRSHLTGAGNPKVAYGSKASAEKAARKMREKHGYWYSNYKCLHCDGYHLGRNSENKTPLDQ